MILWNTAEDISAFLYVYLDLDFNGECQGATEPYDANESITAVVI